MNPQIICDNISINNGRLEFAGCDTTQLANKYGTPLYLFDEGKIRSNCRIYKQALDQYYGNGAMALYASKACCFKGIYSTVAQEGLGIDVVSVGEIYTAVKSGFDMSLAYFQGNNKTDEDIEYAINNGVGYFICDCEEELEAISKIATKKGVNQKVLLRLTPGIDPHTYDEVATGKVDSKFGSAIETGQALSIFKKAIALDGVSVEGIHCHVGSMVFESSVFIRSAEIMLEFMKTIKDEYGFETKILDLGGGYGVRYTKDDPVIDIRDNIRQVCEYIKNECEQLGLTLPSLRLEPGRSIVADAGMTLYTVGSVKKISGYKNYVSIDGGMTDNPRYALYKSAYTVFSASKASDEAAFKADLVGRCCESGDVIQPEVYFPKSIERGDIVAVATTGAYNYSMASNYNRLCRPCAVAIYNGSDRVVIKRETLDDITRLDI